jgi:hypothetical protein
MKIENCTLEIRHSRHLGQALVESMIALGALTIGFLGVMGLLSRSISVFRVTADQYTGSYLASEGIEIVKNLIDARTIRGQTWGLGIENKEYEIDYTTDWDANPPREFNGTKLNYDPVSHLYGYAAPQATSFVRKIHIRRPSADEIAVNSIVSWTTRGGGQFEVDVENHFYNWRP